MDNYKECVVDLNSFFNELYKEKARQFEKSIPKLLNLKVDARAGFSKRIFDDIKLLGQVDNKFFVALDKEKAQLYFFDQHAVHERIRVEMLFKGKNKVGCIVKI